MTHKTPEQLYQEVQQSLGYQLAADLLFILTLPAKWLAKLREEIATLHKVGAQHAHSSKQ